MQERSSNMFISKEDMDMNRLPTEKRAQLVSLLVEGNSLRAASRISSVAFNTVLKFAADAGRARPRDLGSAQSRHPGLHGASLQDVAPDVATAASSRPGSP